MMRRQLLMSAAWSSQVTQIGYNQKTLMLLHFACQQAALWFLQAMMRNSAGSASSANLEGLLRESSAVKEEVIDRAPPPDPNRQDIVLPPKASLKPSHLVSDWQRWSCVAQELGGKNTRQQLMQVGSIGVVILLRTMLQVPHSSHCSCRCFLYTTCCLKKLKKELLTPKN